MVKLSDCVMQHLATDPSCGRTIFLVSGGGCMHLLDSVRRTAGLSYVCNHHEQACAIAAEGYARVTNRIGLALVTTGPGGTNAVTGVMGAWVDSIPLLIVSGQVKLETTILQAPGLRQLGDQEINIVDIVKPITKYAVTVTDKNDIRYVLQKAIFLATTGRPGPVWIDIPLDIQASIIDESNLREFDPSEADPGYDQAAIDAAAMELSHRLATANRPVLIAGNGVRLAGAIDEFRALVTSLKIPVLTAISGIDLLASDHPYFFGRPGILGARAANFIMQNSDLLIVLGTRMNLRIIGYAYPTVARAAYKVMIDADRNELRKPTFEPDLGIHDDAGHFIRRLRSLLPVSGTEKSEWLAYCRRVRDAYPVVTAEHRARTGYVSSYHFAEVLSRHAPPGATIVTGNGCAYTSIFQAMSVKEKQRVFANVGCAAMGYDLPAAIGACCATGGGPIILVTGDGSIMMNLQELQTIISHRMPIKVFLFNNDGYLSMKITQDAFFEGCYTGADPSSGVVIPDLKRIASAFGFKVASIRDADELEQNLGSILETAGPLFCEVRLHPHEKLYPKVHSVRRDDGTMVSRPLEDLFPFLDRDEFRNNMIVKPLED
jgi:acetolactate synthase-1/2/3 large subunit